MYSSQLEVQITGESKKTKTKVEAEMYQCGKSRWLPGLFVRKILSESISNDKSSNVFSNSSTIHCVFPLLKPLDNSLRTEEKDTIIAIEFNYETKLLSNSSKSMRNWN